MFLTRLKPRLPLLPAPTSLRTLGTTTPWLQKAMPPRPKPPPDEELEESYLKGSGPGGQKINKTSSAVQLKHIPTGIVVKSQATRSRSQNRKHARQLLAAKLDDLRNGDQSRSAIITDIQRKKKASATKKSQRKYRLLAEEKLAAADDSNDHGTTEEETSSAHPANNASPAR